MSPVSGFPEGAVELDVERGFVALSVDPTLYPLDAIHAAVMPWLARAFIWLDRSGTGLVRIELRPREAATTLILHQAVGELANELLVAAARVDIAQRRRGLLDAVTRRAVAGAMGRPSLDDLESFDLDDEVFEDPLGIADSWDRSHGKDDR